MSVSEIQTKIQYLARRIALSRRRMTKKQKEMGYFAAREKIKRREDAEESAMFRLNVEEVERQGLALKRDEIDDPITHLFHKFDSHVERSVIQDALDQEMGDIVSTERLLKSAYVVSSVGLLRRLETNVFENINRAYSKVGETINRN